MPPVLKTVAGNTAVGSNPTASLLETDMAKTKRLGIMEMAQTNSKEDWRCPACGGELEKKKDTGEGIKHCTSCQRGWLYYND
jgi:hypothetical protein